MATSTAERGLAGAARIMLPFMAGYFLSYLYRNVNALIGPELAADPSLGGGLDPSALGLLTSTYFLTFAAAQLPLGILLDRYGPRKVEALILILAAAGALVFALSDGIVMLIAGRALIGLGVSACLMAAFKAFRQWFATEKLPLLQGLIMAAGGLGAMTSTVPTEAALSVTDWRGVFIGLAGVTLVIAAAIWIFVPNQSTHEVRESFGDQLRGTASLFTNKWFWVVVPVATIQQSSYLSLQGLWAGPWMQDVAGLSREEMADVLFLMAVTMILGHLATGTVAERLARRGISPTVVFVTGTILFIAVFAALAAGVVLPWVLWPLFTLFGTAGILSYAILAQVFPASMAGRVNTTVNLMIFAAAFVMQWGIGAIIGLWPSDADGHYPVEGYSAAFGLAALLLALAQIWLFIALRRARAQDKHAARESSGGARGERQSVTSGQASD